MDVIEGHPIPQDITGFQFRIIGDLTVKQFAYLGVGLLLGWLFLSIPLPFIIKAPLVIIFGGTGIFLAFVPIQGRPADTMLLLFFKAVLKPNEYTYEKQALPQVSSTQSVPGQTVQQVLPVSSATGTQQMDHVVETLTTELAQAKATEAKEAHTPQAEAAHEKVLELERQLSNVMQEKQELEKQLLLLQKQLQEKQEQQVVAPPTPIPAPATKQEEAVKITPTLPATPDAPNLVFGIVKDPRGNVLQNILIEVKDTEGNPVRAFKTNAQGHFASATPLLNGKYTITFEDPKGQQQFDTITITADGRVFPPFEIVSVDEREKLRKSLFGG